MEFKEIFPVAVRQELPENFLDGLEEIRIRAEKPMELLYGDGTTVRLGLMQRKEIQEMLNYLSGYSMYALQEELRQGFFTMEGGHRVGVTGHVARAEETGENKKSIQGVFDISGMNIRVAHERKGCAAQLVEKIRTKTSIYNTLILAPPGVGKTTYLRDSIRLLSMGDAQHLGMKVAVVDERSEIAACYQGVPQNDLGPRTDVLDNCPKERGMLMMIRSMSPQVIAVDELGEEGDFFAVHQAIYSGSRILGTIHAENIEELYEKPYMKRLLDAKMIGRFVCLSRLENGKRKMQIYDETMCLVC